MRYDFEWDPKKARGNIRKHKVNFERATSVFRDPNLLSIPDVEGSRLEERWITIGLDENGVLLVLSHKFMSLDDESSRIRIISARKASKAETKQYEKGI
ncbi:MAG: BrnT family toxin [Chloracidobacterium sp.]|nr:BrnT family toxin [Chloracidobacterium sp.]MBK7803204.1 BrnT family toxin [Chloracidobacterium sp.]MBK9767547.1 BrnT family toxin [Chloracidobacterium sp.]MBL0240975.1 BrnT family toxin [Chloracidobacterium sp.]MBP9934765.1 BrnT family toxin [Pyrinomonadaceae bacterium]